MIWIINAANQAANASPLMGFVPNPEPVATQEAQIRALQKAVADIKDLEKAVTNAQAMVERAEKLVETRAKGWDKVMAAYSKASKDAQTLFGAIGKVLKEAEKLA